MKMNPCENPHSPFGYTVSILKKKRLAALHDEWSSELAAQLAIRQKELAQPTKIRAIYLSAAGLSAQLEHWSTS